MHAFTIRKLVSSQSTGLSVKNMTKNCDCDRDHSQCLHTKKSESVVQTYLNETRQIGCAEELANKAEIAKLEHEPVALTLLANTSLNRLYVVRLRYHVVLELHVVDAFARRVAVGIINFISRFLVLS